MKLTAIISLLALTLLGSNGTALAQHQNQKPVPPQELKPAPAQKPDFGQERSPCPCNIIGTWKAQISTTEARLYSFDSEGVVKVLKVSGTAQPQEIATGKYELLENMETMENMGNMEHPNTLSKQISFTATRNKIFGRKKATIDVVSFDDSSMTCSIPGIGKTRWTRVDPDRYFIVFVAREGEFYDNSGSAFPMVIKLTGGVPKIDAAGTYSVSGKAAFGAVPPNAYKDYLREARGDSEVILRLEINSQQYERTLKVVQEWQRRARENALLYRPPDSLVSLNNVLLVRDVTETLNLCQNDFDLYKLDYVYPSDWIADSYSPEFIPFFFFKELRRRNEARHIEYKKFQELVPLSHLASR